VREIVAYLRIKELAEARGMCLADFRRATKLPISTARRLWYGSATGLERDAGTLKALRFDILLRITHVLEVNPVDLLVADPPVEHTDA
jgi:DNA-binding Xre family transcriptional regulator